jgi:phage baseplate assembly protein W
MSGMSPKLPLGRDPDDGYTLNKTLKEVARQNLKMVILTAPGERIMIPEFGVGLRHTLFENATPETLLVLKRKILDQVGRYTPYIQINSVDFRQEIQEYTNLGIEPSSTSNYLHLSINYSIDSGFTSETLIINL